MCFLNQVEKYRPAVLDDVVGNAEAVARLKAIAAEGNLPNLIFAGPPGCGKTTAVLALARALLGDAHVRDAVLELNASDDRGIDTVRNKIKMFAQTKVTLPPGCHKIVFLDEADAMTTAAQQALRRTMELYSATTRFALACNASEKVIEPLQSRCAIVRFARLSDAELLGRLLAVTAAERVPTVPGGLEAVVFTADGDMRQALNNLQATFSGFGLVDADNVFKVCDQPHPLAAAAALEQCSRGVAGVDDAYAAVKALADKGYGAMDVIGTLFRVTKSMDDAKLPEALKLAYCREIGFAHMRAGDGVASLLQLSGGWDPSMSKLVKPALTRPAGLVAKLCRAAEAHRGGTR